MLPIVVDLSVVSIRPLLPAPSFGEARMDGASESESVHLLVCCKPEAFEVWKIYRYGGRRFLSLRSRPPLWHRHRCFPAAGIVVIIISHPACSGNLHFLYLCVCLHATGREASNEQVRGRATAQKTSKLELEELKEGSIVHFVLCVRRRSSGSFRKCCARPGVMAD